MISCGCLGDGLKVESVDLTPTLVVGGESVMGDIGGLVEECS